MDSLGLKITLILVFNDITPYEADKLIEQELKDMEEILKKKLEEDVISIYTTLAGKAMEYSSTFGGYREEMYR